MVGQSIKQLKFPDAACTYQQLSAITVKNNLIKLYLKNCLANTLTVTAEMFSNSN